MITELLLKHQNFELFNSYTNYCTYIKFIKFIHYNIKNAPRTETSRSVFNVLMCKFYICAVVGIIIE